MANQSDVGMMLLPWGARNPSENEIVEVTKLAEEPDLCSLTLPTRMTMPAMWLFRTFHDRDFLDAMAVLPVISVATSTIGIGVNSAFLPLVPP